MLNEILPELIILTISVLLGFVWKLYEKLLLLEDQILIINTKLTSLLSDNNEIKECPAIFKMSTEINVIKEKVENLENNIY